MVIRFIRLHPPLKSPFEIYPLFEIFVIYSPPFKSDNVEAAGMCTCMVILKGFAQNLPDRKPTTGYS